MEEEALSPEPCDCCLLTCDECQERIAYEIDEAEYTDALIFIVEQEARREARRHGD